MTKSFATIEENLNQLVLNSNTDIDPTCSLSISFMRTLRIPDDNKKYNLPPGLGKFPLKHIEDYDNIPAKWKNHGGVFFPVYQSEAMWLKFDCSWPFAIKVAAGKINAVSGEEWNPNLKFKKTLLQSTIDRREQINPFPGQPGYPNKYLNGIVSPILSPIANNYTVEKIQPDYMVVPKQPWLDGFNVGKGVVRQFISVPLGNGYTAEEQLTGKAEHGGIQIIAYPMKKEHYDKIKEQSRGINNFSGMICASGAPSSGILRSNASSQGATYGASTEMGLGAGGFMKQEIYEDTYSEDVWDLENPVRVFVHLVNSLEYQNITGELPPTKPLNPKDYEKHNYPWFDHYSDGPVLEGSKELAKLDSVASIDMKKNQHMLEDNSSFKQPTPQKTGKKIVSKGNW